MSDSDISPTPQTPTSPPNIISTQEYSKHINRLSGGFRWRWIRNRRVSLMIIVLILMLGGFSAYRIPKESSPTISFGIIGIRTVYPGVNSIDMDNLITDKIEWAIQDIQWIKKISSTSNIGIASTNIELYNDVDTKKVLQEIKDEINKLRLPEDAEDPIVTEISTNNEIMFQMVLYGPQYKYPKTSLIEFAKSIKHSLEGTNGITDITIWGWFDRRSGAPSVWQEKYEIDIQIDKDKVQSLGLTLSQISNAIRSSNKNQPLGTYELWWLNYDFRIQWEYTDLQDLMQTSISNNAGYDLKLQDIATMSMDYQDDAIVSYGSYKKSGYNAITLTFNKRKGSNVFDSSDQAKKAISTVMSASKYKDLSYTYTTDLAETIRKDYNNLTSSGLQTLIIVFLCMLVFVSIKEALIGVLSIPLAFFITFMVLDYQGRTLNFLTNFSLVLTLGIIIDLAIVIAEAAYNNMKLWFHAKTAVWMASRDYSTPLIAGTATTIIVFVPLLFLPGVTGKFLAYIPVTVFSTLSAALVIWLTLSGVLFYLFNRNYRRYTPDVQKEQFLKLSDYEILMVERQSKELKTLEQSSRKEQLLAQLDDWYAKTLRRFLTNRTERVASIFLPVVLLILSFIFLSPRIWFELFPWGDNNRVDFSATFRPGTTTTAAWAYIPMIQNKLSQYPEIKNYLVSANSNTISMGIDLIDKDDRSRSAFDLEQAILDDLQFMTAEGIKVESQVLAGGPPTSKPVAIQLIADETKKFVTLKQISRDFEQQLKTYTGTKNILSSAPDSPGQFVFELNKAKLGLLGLSPAEVMNDLSSALNGVYGGTLKIQDEDVDIKIMYEWLQTEVSPSAISDLVITTRNGPIRVGELMTYRIDTSVWAITREDGNIMIRVDADLEESYSSQWPAIQEQFESWAKSYPFPAGISYKSGWEQSDNADLIQTTMIGFLVALFAIYMILVLEFNSFSQPAIIMYSVILGMLGVNIGLYLTGNPYSMPFMIWLIAMTGIVVDNAAVILERVNENVEQWVDIFEAIIEACKSRLQPMILTSATDFLWLLPVAFQDKFWQGLAFTISFWLLAGATMTLFVIPSIYYIVYTWRHSKAKKKSL